MHWMLRVISLGHVRTLTHHRLLLLEQKFQLHVMLNAGADGGGWAALPLLAWGMQTSAAQCREDQAGSGWALVCWYGSLPNLS